MLANRAAAMLAAAFFVLATATGCGGEDEDPVGAPEGAPELTVSAAASLKTALTSYAEGFTPARARLSFAGSDELAAQIRQGVKPDVYASANTKLPETLFEEGLVEEPKAFAASSLVLAVPARSDAIESLDELGEEGVTLAIGAEAVPVGAYTREVLARLDPVDSKRILANVRSSEPDVAGIVGKLTQGAVDAGFVYLTDVTATDGRLKAIELPARLQPQVAYGVAVVKGAKNPDGARQFVDGLLNGDGADALRAAGFEPPPPPK